MSEQPKVEYEEGETIICNEHGKLYAYHKRIIPKDDDEDDIL